MLRICEKGHLGVLREWVVGGGGIYGHFGEQATAGTTFPLVEPKTLVSPKPLGSLLKKLPALT